MARNKPKPNGDGGEDEILQQLRAQSGGGWSDFSRPLDGALLAMVVWAIQAKGGAVQFGTSRDGSKMSIKVWYKGFPTQDYASSVEDMEARLAMTLRIFLPKDERFDEWRTHAETFI